MTRELGVLTQKREMEVASQMASPECCPLSWPRLWCCPHMLDVSVYPGAMAWRPRAAHIPQGFALTLSPCQLWGPTGTAWPFRFPGLEHEDMISPIFRQRLEPLNSRFF